MHPYNNNNNNNNNNKTLEASCCTFPSNGVGVRWRGSDTFFFFLVFFLYIFRNRVILKSLKDILLFIFISRVVFTFF
jgi:hypothetical protein